MKGFKRVYDELYGFIRLGGVVRDVVDTPVFQRLRRIRQLSAAYLVYPGATHTRFSHSLGTMHLMGKLVDRLVAEGSIRSDEADLLKLAALLYNIGVFPFAHSLESLYLEADKGLDNKYLASLILEKTELRDVLSSWGYRPGEIMDLIRGNSGSGYSVLLRGDLDIRKLDYLRRDAHHTGVAYGMVDADRLLETMGLSGKGDLVVDIKGLRAVENFYVARLHMYQSVYYHKTIIGYELLLRLIYRRLAEELPEVSETLTAHWIREIVEEGEVAYWDDEWVFSRLYVALGSDRVSSDVKKMIRGFLDRNGLRILVDLSKLSMEPPSSADYAELEDYRKRIEGVVPEDAVALFADSIPVFRRKPVLIRVRGRELPINSAELDALPLYLPKYYNVLRIYVAPEYRERAREMLFGPQQPSQHL